MMAKKKDTPAPKTFGVTAIGGMAAALGLGAVVAGLWWKKRPAGNAEHKVSLPAPDAPRPSADERAPVDFRPDPTAPVPASEREGLRPATGPTPTMVDDRGAMNSQTGPANG